MFVSFFNAENNLNEVKNFSRQQEKNPNLVSQVQMQLALNYDCD